MARPGEDVPLGVGAASPDTSALLRRFVKDGFVLQPDVLQPRALAELTDAFRTARAPVMAAWERSGAREGNGAASRSFDMNDFGSPESFLRSEVWVKILLENPVIRSLAQAVCGAGHQLYEVDARTVPPVSPEDGAERGGYVRWHRDSPLIKGGICKVFVYLNDVGFDGGCTAVVPGSHRWALSSEGSGTTFPVSEQGNPASGEIKQHHEFDRERVAHVGGHAAQDAMPGHVKIACRAGSMLAFDTRCAHTAFANTSNISRYCIILIFCPKWHKQRADVAALADALNSDGLLDTSLRRQLFGFEDANGATIARRGFL